MKSEPRTVEELRAEGLRLYYANALDEALPLFDRALAIAEDDETRDALVLHKASVHVAMRRVSEEVQALPKIMMRRPHLRGMAAYHLATRFENEKDYGRARFYVEIAREAAEAAGDLRLLVVSTIDLGNLCVYDSRPEDAIPVYESALALLAEERTAAVCSEAEAQLWAAFATQNLGYCRIVTEHPEEGVALIHRAIEMFEACGGEAYTAESHLDLCLGYLDLGRLDEARRHGQIGLERATEERQVRNAHYLLGEVAYESGDLDQARRHFESLAAWYPDFPQLQNLLFAIDLRNMVNFKL